MDTGCWLYYNTLIKLQRYSQRVFGLRTHHSLLQLQDGSAAANSTIASGVSTLLISFALLLLFMFGYMFFFLLTNCFQ